MCTWVLLSADKETTPSPPHACAGNEEMKALFHPSFKIKELLSFLTPPPPPFHPPPDNKKPTGMPAPYSVTRSLSKATRMSSPRRSISSFSNKDRTALPTAAELHPREYAICASVMPRQSKFKTACSVGEKEGGGPSKVTVDGRRRR